MIYEFCGNTNTSMARREQIQRAASLFACFGKKPEHIKIVFNEVDEENWG
jgi:phenylpyruvate tautomerase PptA (4-oxalocrotonate tautomerase family)